MSEPEKPVEQPGAPAFVKPEQGNISAAKHHLEDRAAALVPPALPSIAKGLAPLLVGIVISYAIHLLTARILGEYHAKIVLDIGINIILAVSLNMVNGFTGQFSMGHAGFMALGGYTAGVVTYYGSMKLWGSPQQVDIFLGAGEWLFVVGCLLGGVVSAMAGYVVGLPSLRLRGDYLAIVTLGFGEILRVLIQQTPAVLDSPEKLAAAAVHKVPVSVGGSLGFIGLPTYTNLFWVYIFVTIILVTAYRLKTSSWGRAFLSVRENEIAAEAMGIHTTKVKVRAFVLSAFFAGIAGGLFAHELGTTLKPDELGFQKSFDFIIMVVLGGMGSISGAALAAILLTILPEALRNFADYRLIIYALLLIVMMIVRPQGLFGIKELWDWKSPLDRFLKPNAPPPAKT